ncbi:hypothetical protein AVEN_226047-1 [Araneus ventricosus]|uniref:Integrase catalytic domain-containing protein n=1 Tax=Araneus ventricosus TaxID=182803 RepID=A0A4Y2IJB1_ARAVE|nr:hypothetical protein AVEN_226047-1 [Araneus ventricosus]
MAVAQDSDVELRSLLESGSGLELKQLQLPSSQRLLYCDISTGATKTRTTSFHPAANGIVERMHRQLKAALKCYTNSSWLEVLPTVLLGMRACLKEDIGASHAEMVYGQRLRLPGEVFRNTTSSRQMLSEDTFLQRLRPYTRRLIYFTL